MKNLSLVGPGSLLYIFIVITGYTSSSLDAILSLLSVGVTMLMLLYTKFGMTGKFLNDKSIKCFLLFMVYCMVVLMYAPGSVHKYVLSRYSLFFPLLMSVYFVEEKHRAKTILYISLALWIIISIRAVYLYSSDAVNARYIANGRYTGNIMTGGGYGFAIGSAIMCSYLIEMILWKKMKKSFLNIAIIILLMLVVHNTRSTITIIAMYIGILLSYIFRAAGVNNLKVWNGKKVVALFLSVLSIIVFFLSRDIIGKFIIDATSGSENIVDIRLNEIGVFLYHGSDSSSYASSDMADRMERLGSSFRIFFRYPILGAMLEYGSNHFTLQSIGLGSHGELFDAFGRYGLLGGLPYLGIFIYSGLKERRMQKSPIGLAYVAVFIILMIFNPFLYSQSCMMWFFLIPMMTYVFNSKENEDEE